MKKIILYVSVLLSIIIPMGAAYSISGGSCLYTDPSHPLIHYTFTSSPDLITLATQMPEIQPGAFDAVDFNIQINPENGWGVCGGSYSDALTAQPDSSPPCHVLFYPCGLPGIFDSNNGAPSYYNGQCDSGSGCNLYSSNPGATPPTFTYTPGVEPPGNYHLCFSLTGTAYKSGAAYSSDLVNPSCKFTISGSTNQASNYVVSPVAPSVSEVFNSELPNAAYKIAAPVQVSITDANGIPTQVVTWPDSVNVVVTGDGSYPLFLELSGAGTDNCIYGGILQISGQSPPTEISGKLQACTQAPVQSQLPCVLSYTHAPNGYDPIAMPSNAYIFSTADLVGANTFTVCGYEGNGIASGDPAPVFSATNVFVLQCPPDNPTCGTVGGPTQPQPVAVTSVQAEICTLYLQINALLLLLAIVLILVGAALYGGGNIMPGQSKGVMQGYAFGMITAGVASIAIVAISVWLLSVVAGYPVQSILALNGCPV